MLKYNLEAEFAVLASCLFDNSIITEILNIVSHDNFSDDNSKPFKIIEDLYDKGMTIDPIIFNAEIKRLNINFYHENLMNHNTTFAHAKYYADIVRDLYFRRKIEHEMSLLSEKIYTTDNIETTLDSFKNRVEIQKSDFKISDAAESVTQTIEYYQSGFDGKFAPLKTGFNNIDEILRGFEIGSLNIIGAGTSIGKSTLALNLALNYITAHKTVVVFSLEMRKEQLVNRMLSNFASIPFWRIKEFQLNNQEYSNYFNFASKLAELKFFINDTFRLHVNDLKTYLTRLSKNQKIDVVIIDYLQQIKSDKKQVREQEIASITRELKILSEEFNCVIIAMSQLNRQASARTEKTPQLSDLRESGSIEQDADSVIFIHRENLESDVADIIIAKNRHGMTGKCQLMFRGNFYKFEDLKGGF